MQSADSQDLDSQVIHEGRGRFPWWVWVVVAAWLVFAFFLAPFDLLSPLT